jgi:hypothetical protein
MQTFSGPRVCRRAVSVLALGFCFAPAAAGAQTVLALPTSPVLPRCSFGNMVAKTGSNAGLYWCVATNTWAGPLKDFTTAPQAISADWTFNSNLTMNARALKMNGSRTDSMFMFSNSSALSPLFSVARYAVGTVDTGIRGPADIVNGLELLYYSGGGNAVPVVATAVGLQNNVVVTGAGNNWNENIAEGSFVRTEIGTGYTQTSAPAGITVLKDLGMQGPVDVQPLAWDGVRVVGNNHYNGQPTSTDSALFYAITQQATGPEVDTVGSTAATYPINAGFSVLGRSTAGPNNIGFNVAFRAGGSGSGFGVPSSSIGVGLDVQQYQHAGVNIHGAGTPSAPSVKFDTFLQASEVAAAPAAPPADSAVIYARDNGAGKTQLCAKFSTGPEQCFTIEP